MPLYCFDGFAPRITRPETVWIAPGAHVIGKVSLGSDVSVWFNAVLRGDTAEISVDDGTNIQDGAMLHADPGYPLSIGSGCTIGHHAIVHGCTIGDNVLVGMGATILNGAAIGANCLIGANALVTEGKAFPSNSLIIGAPARVVRTLTSEELASLSASAERYVAKARLFATTLKSLD